ncbi:MAG TPA: hypothetical protein VGS98_02475 [Thermoanaerobaculia bacterium]|jgi:hypothetical protein|nr:hypothetical protein [Thermoanaerobaculia bacterium]
MADRRTSERLLVQPDHVEDITMDPPGPVVLEKVGERLIVPPESLDRVCMNETRRETEDRTEPIRLSFLALLAERDPLVQTRLNRRITPLPEDEELDENRPTDPMILTAKVSG